jgi:UDPglucose--hexose-1-phosphate uridylyltransferase
MLRHDITTDEWVVYAPQRARRPRDFRRAVPAEIPAPGTPTMSCPFCAGNEAMTPSEIDSERPAGADGWTVRVVPNLYPALLPEARPDRAEDGPLFASMGGHGFHEVLIESPDHHAFLGFLPAEQVFSILKVVARRARALLASPEIPMVVPFKNHGEEAGASLRHPHWQIIGSPVVSQRSRTRLRLAAEYRDRHGRNLYESLRDAELAVGSRVLHCSDRFVAFLPFASHAPFETWIVPRFRQASFSRASDDDLTDLAVVLRKVLRRIYLGLGDPAFNLAIDTVPRGEEDRDDFLWTIQIRPRLSIPAGFEMGSGMSINPVLPEAAREYLANVTDPRLFD